MPIKIWCSRVRNALLIICVLFIFSCTTIPRQKTGSAAGATSRLQLNNGKGAYQTKNYRNIFAEYGHSQQQINSKIDAAYQQLFQGDSATQKIYFQAGSNTNGPLGYVLDLNNNDIRSEGMSYGMMIAVQMDKKAMFDALWNYAVSLSYISDTAHPAEGYFAWSLRRDGTPNSETPAPDGEEYFVTALYFASGRWGNGHGIYNYKAWADKILFTMRNHPIKTGRIKNGSATVGPMINEERKMILFTPNGPGREYSDPSYHLPHFYELWARWGPASERSFWASAADTSRNYFYKAAHPVTGLAPDYGHFDGRPVVTTFNRNSANFAYDSWRTAMNWSVDWNWWRKDQRQQELSNRIQTFFSSQGLASYGSVYTLDGKRVSAGHATGLVATNAAASLAATHTVAKDFVEAFWNAPIPYAFGERYYSGLLYMMSLLHCSGRFRIYEP